jgi:hypothetical protein
MSVDLNRVADVLDKTAAYIEEVEASKVRKVAEEKTKAASALAERLTDATGEEIDTEMVGKLAELSPEVSGLISKLAGGEVVDPLGGPSTDDKVKTASAGVSLAEQRYAEWLSSE